MNKVVDMKGEDYKPLPSNLEAEQAYLGAILITNAGLEKTSFLKAEHFFEPVHGRIYEAIVKLAEKGQTADPIKLKPYFEDDPALEDVGGTSYIVRLASSAPTVFNPEDYAQTIYDLALRRDLIEIGERIMLKAYDSPIDGSPKDQIEQAEQLLFNMAPDAKQGGFVRFSTALKEGVKAIEIASKSPSGVSGVTTGLAPLDRLLGGLHDTDLIILGGRPAMGKTALATNIGVAAAKAFLQSKPEGAKVGFFSKEMSRDQLANRTIAEKIKVSSDRLRKGQLNQTEQAQVYKAEESLCDLPFFIDDTPGLNIPRLRARARRLKRLEDVGLIIVDYLQLMTGKSENRVQEISGITRGLKNLAKELRVPVLALSQLSRNVENRDNKRPQLADLRDSGTIEQDADVVMFVYRGEYYWEWQKPTHPDKIEDPKAKEKAKKEYDKWQGVQNTLVGKAEVIIGKQRHGPTGTVRLGFDKELTRFFELGS